jgi:hypothetical protein
MPAFTLCFDRKAILVMKHLGNPIKQMGTKIEDCSVCCYEFQKN